MNFVTAPLIADLFLLAILAIGKMEVKAGTLGAENISPIDIMVFFLSLAYIAIRYVIPRVLGTQNVSQSIESWILTFLEIVLMLRAWSDIWRSRCFSGEAIKGIGCSSTSTPSSLL
jgi:hypothetical protein